MAEKHCPKCGLCKATSEFYTTTTSPDGLAAWCIACMKKASQEKYLQRVDLPVPWKGDLHREAGLLECRMEVLNGIIEKPSTCMTCGASRKLYPFWEGEYKAESVKWYCSKCHKVYRKYVEEKERLLRRMSETQDM